MDVKFIAALKENIDETPIVDGQIIVSKDTDDMFYDMYGDRHHVSGSGDVVWKGISDDHPAYPIVDMEYDDI